MGTACRGPSSNSDMRLTACVTDSVEPLVSEIGNVIFQADVRHAVMRRTANSMGRGYVNGNNAATVATPATMTVAAYRRTACGCARHPRQSAGIVTGSSTRPG